MIKTLVIIIYYALSIIMYLCIYKNIIWDYDYVIYKFSKILFNICYNFIPIIFLFLPIMLKIIFNRCFNKSMLYSFIIVIMYIPILLIINLSITIYMKNFTLEKWHEKSVHLRHLMIEDFEDKYKPIGANKEDIINILGVDYSRLRDNDNSLCYVIEASGFDAKHYCFIYNENDIITDIKYNYY